MIDAAQEQAMWRAIGEVEGRLLEVEDEVLDEVIRLRRLRRAFVFALLIAIAGLIYTHKPPAAQSPMLETAVCRPIGV